MFCRFGGKIRRNIFVWSKAEALIIHVFSTCSTFKNWVGEFQSFNFKKLVVDGRLGIDYCWHNKFKILDSRYDMILCIIMYFYNNYDYIMLVRNSH